MDQPPPPPLPPNRPRGWFLPVDGDNVFIVGRPVRWGIGDAIAALLIAYASAIIGNTILFVILGSEDGPSFDDMPMWAFAVAQTFLWVGYCGSTLLSSFRRGNGPRLDFGWKFQRSDIYQGLIVGVATQFVVVPIIYFFIFLVLPRQDVSEAARDLVDRAPGASILLLAVVVVVGAPIVEELFFRGLLLRSLERRFGATWALVVSSLLFAAVHLQPLLLPAHAVFGFIAGWLTLRTGRLGPAVWAHVFFNAGALLGLWLLAS